MTTADFTPGQLDIAATAGDDCGVVLHFNTDMTGYTSWTAKARYGSTVITLAVNTGAIGAGFVVVTLTAAQSLLFTQAAWSLRAIDPFLAAKTLLAGTITTESAP